MNPRTPDLFRFGFEVLNVLSFSVEVFLRHSFGERYVNWMRLIFSLLTLQAVLGVMRFFQSLPFVGGGLYPSVSSYFWYSFLALSGFHLLRIWWHNRKGTAWHSRSFGISHLAFLPFNDNVLHRWVEPLACLTVSWLLHPLSPFTANWLLVSSLCLLIKNNLIYNAHRARMLDVVDGRIEAAVMAGKLEGKDKRKTAGWSNVVTMPTELDFAEAETERPDVSTEQEAQALVATDFAATVAALMDGPGVEVSRLDDGATTDEETGGEEDRMPLVLAQGVTEDAARPQKGGTTHDLHTS